MFEAILEILVIMGWLGVVLGLLIIANTISGTLSNVWFKNETFSWKKFFQGVIKAVVFYGCSTFMSIAFTMLPFINQMIANSFGEVLFSEEMLNTLSSAGVLAIVVAAVIVQGKKALENIIELSKVSYSTEQITWDVVEEEEEDE